jgi:hypothetical protein
MGRGNPCSMHAFVTGPFFLPISYKVPLARRQRFTGAHSNFFISDESITSQERR